MPPGLLLSTFARGRRVILRTYQWDISILQREGCTYLTYPWSTIRKMVWNSSFISGFPSSSLSSIPTLNLILFGWKEPVIWKVSPSQWVSGSDNERRNATAVKIGWSASPFLMRTWYADPPGKCLSCCRPGGKGRQMSAAIVVLLYPTSTL